LDLIYAQARYTQMSNLHGTYPRTRRRATVCLAMTASPRTGTVPVHVSGIEVITKCQQRQDGSRTHEKSSASLTKHDLSSFVVHLAPDADASCGFIGIGYMFDEYSTSVCLLLYGLLDHTCVNYLTPSLLDDVVSLRFPFPLMPLP
jgi:hypothetical protein